MAVVAIIVVDLLQNNLGKVDLVVAVPVKDHLEVALDVHSPQELLNKILTNLVFLILSANAVSMNSAQSIFSFALLWLHSKPVAPVSTSPQQAVSSPSPMSA